MLHLQEPLLHPKPKIRPNAVQFKKKLDSILCSNSTVVQTTNLFIALCTEIKYINVKPIKKLIILNTHLLLNKGTK